MLQKTVFFLFFFLPTLFFAGDKSQLKKGPQQPLIDRKKIRKQDALNGSFYQERTEQDWKALEEWYNGLKVVKHSTAFQAYEFLAHKCEIIAGQNDELRSQLEFKERMWKEQEHSYKVIDNNLTLLVASYKKKHDILEEENERLKTQNKNFESCLNAELFGSLYKIFNALVPSGSPQERDLTDCMTLERKIIDLIVINSKNYDLQLKEYQESYEILVAELKQNCGAAETKVKEMHSAKKAASSQLKEKIKECQQLKEELECLIEGIKNI